MTNKNETGVLVLSLLITMTLIGGIYWLFAKNIPGSQPSPSTSESETFTSVPNVPAGLFSYGGSTTWAPIRKDVDSAIKNAVPKFDLRYTDPITGSPSSGSGIEMLLNNQLSFSQSSRPIKDSEYQTAQQRGFTLKEIPVAIDGIAFTVNPQLNVPGLTLAQIKDIYTGKITNWQQVGGPDLAIAAYSRKSEGGTVEFFIENILQKEAFGNNIQTVSTTTEGLRKVIANRGGIYYASAPEVVGQCGIKTLPIGRTTKQLVPPYLEPLIAAAQCPQQRNQLNIEAFKNNQYPMTRRLFVIVKQNNQVDEQAGNAYANLLLTEQGQKLISQAGFVRIR